MNSDFDVIIVGGGAAGIGAARTLAAHKLSTLLLEATPRLGGRACTHDVGGYPLDFGCGWLHSADRNAWVDIAEASGFEVDHRQSVWDKPSVALVFTKAEQAAAQQAFLDWNDRLYQGAAVNDRASEVLEAGGAWNAYVQAMTGFLSGVGPDQISIVDYLAYDTASTRRSWRLPLGYGKLVAASLPPSVTLRMATPAESIDIATNGVFITTRAGIIRARAAILTVSTSVLSGDAIRLPSGLDPWREAAASLPLGRNEKLFLEVKAGAAFEAESLIFGSLQDTKTAAYHVRPFGRPVIEAFLGGDGARILEADGPAAGFSHVLGEMAALFGRAVLSCLQPLAIVLGPYVLHWRFLQLCPSWPSGRSRVPGSIIRGTALLRRRGDAQLRLLTAHGAYESGRRAANDVLTTFQRTAHYL